jgi:hypothetical protein
LYENFFSPIRAKCLAHLMFLDLISRTTAVRKTDHTVPLYEI